MPSLFPKGFPDPAVWERPPFDKRPWRNVRIYDTYRQSPDVGPLLFEAFSTAFEMADPEYGGIRIRIEPRTEHQDPPIWITELCVADWDGRWFRDWATAFSQHPASRGPYKDAKNRNRHPTQVVDLPAGPAAIDEALVEPIRALNAQGILTISCCQRGSWGDCSGGAIGLQSGHEFPADLAAAWHAADIHIFTGSSGHQTVMPSVPFGNEAAAAERFRQSLQDWMHGTLDFTGDAYRMTDLLQSRPMSRPPLDVPLSPALRHPDVRGPVIGLGQQRIWQPPPRSERSPHDYP